MENFGCIVYKDKYMLVSDSEEDKTAMARRQRIARLVFHEVCHQW